MNWAAILANDAVAKSGMTIFTSILTTLLTIKAKTWGDRKKGVLTEVRTHLKSLQEWCLKISNEAENHLTGQTALKSSQKNVGIWTKHAYGVLDTLKQYLPHSVGQDLENRFLNWHRTLTGNGYPIQRKDQILDDHDPRIQAINQAHRDFNSHLELLVRQCVEEKLSPQKCKKTR